MSVLILDIIEMVFTLVRIIFLILCMSMIQTKAAHKFKATTSSNHCLPVAPNLLKQDFTATRPTEK
jgi:predicted tellurium resistance membrane protein TerC